jgi:peptide/nickel transport system permease protein
VAPQQVDLQPETGLAAVDVTRKYAAGGRFAFLHRGLPLFSGTILASFVVVGAIGPFFTPHDPTRVDLANNLLPPAFFPGGVWTYPLGTDQLGRDMLSRLIGGARVSLLVALVVVLVSGAFGTTIAMLSGYLGGRLDSFLMRLTDAALAFPFLLVAIVLAGIFGPSIQIVILTIALVGWASYARVIRSEVLSLKTRDFVTMASVMGAGPAWIIRRHLLPNVTGSIVVLATLQLGRAIVSEAALSFLGIGVRPPAPSWGGMLSDSQQYLIAAWWLPTLPGLALSLTVLSSNLMGDWLRKLNDPTQRH